MLVVIEGRHRFRIVMMDGDWTTAWIVRTGIFRRRIFVCDYNADSTSCPGRSLGFCGHSYKLNKMRPFSLPQIDCIDEEKRYGQRLLGEYFKVQ
jgi:hypothetical protein